jgi:hypothetical protein
MNDIPSIEELDEKIQARVNVLADHDPQICTLRGAKEMLSALNGKANENMDSSDTREDTAEVKKRTHS